MYVDFASWTYGLLGGVLVGLAGLGLLLCNGQIFGVSGILGGVLRGVSGAGWRLSVLAGLLVGGALSYAVAPASLAVTVERSLAISLLAGVLVGVGTQLGSGCTSGHGVCGIGRLSPRSIVATVAFTLVGMATVAALRLLAGGVS